MDYARLEKDVKFKRFYLSKTPWWKNLSLISPILLIFIGVAGILDCSNFGLLYSWKTVPYAVVFLVGIFLLKYVKTSLQRKTLDQKDAFLCCASALVGVDKGYAYYIFDLDKRYSESSIRKIAGNVDFATLVPENLKGAKKMSIPVDSEEKVMLCGFSMSKLKKEYGNNSPSEISIVYLSDKYVFPIKPKFLKKK